MLESHSTCETSVSAVSAPPVRPSAAKQAAHPAAQHAIPELLARLVAIEPGRYRVVSCYLRLATEDRPRRKYLVELKDRLREATDPRSAEDAERILAFLSQEQPIPGAGGLAIFACGDLDLFEAVPLPSVHRTRVVVDDTPWVRELVAIDREFGGMLAVLIDRGHARFFHVTASGAVELPGLASVSRRGGKFHSDRRDSPGWGEHDYHNRIREERHREHAAVSHRITELAASLAPRGILLAGPQKETAALARFLPRGLAARLVGTARLNPTAVTADQVRAATFAAAAQRAKVEAAALAAALQDALGARWATNGPAETLRALVRGQVSTLIVREDAELSGYRCSCDDHLVVSASDCHGAPLPVRDLVDEAVEEALRQHVEVIVLDGPAAARIDQMAAFLRFR
jgi:peptide subunit release factor 1 (eRF1)